MVNQALVDKYFGGRDPIGHVHPVRRQQAPRDRRRRRRCAISVRRAAPRIRRSTCRSSRTTSAGRSSRSRSGPTARRRATTSAAALLRSAVREADPQQPISRLRTIEEILSGSMAAAPIQHLDRRTVRRHGAAAGRDRHLRRDGVRRHQPDARARRPRGARRDARGSRSGWCWVRDCC